MKTCALNLREVPSDLRLRLKVEALQKHMSLRDYVISILQKEVDGLNKRRASNGGK